jgi:hypothetical protein
MKRRVFSKTTPFHAFKKKKEERAERCRFERHYSSSSPDHAAGKKEKGKLFFEFFPATLSPGAHRPDTMADHPPRTYQKAERGGPDLGSRTNGRPAGCSP